MAKSKDTSSYPAYELPTYGFVKPPELCGRQNEVYPVVIVGAGLSGLTLACRLAQLGVAAVVLDEDNTCLLYTSPSPRDRQKSRMPSSA